MGKIKDSEEKIFRILKIIKRLEQKEVLNGENLANEFNVDVKTIQRDIKTLKDYLFEESDSDIKYSRAKNGYYLKSNDNKSLTNEAILAISKIILESRAFNKGETDNLIDKLINQMSGNDRNIIKDLISNEKFNYIPLQHGKDLLSVIWNLAQSIKNQEWLCLNYTTKSNEGRKYNVKPLSIMFSEYYFYLNAYIEAREEYPAIFRIDRITEIKDINKKFKINYLEKFEDGKFRKYIQFMHSGPLTKIKFRYRGYLEYVLDRFPTAEVLAEEAVGEGNSRYTVYTVSIEVYGNFGAEMWLRSQGDYVVDYEILK